MLELVAISRLFRPIIWVIAASAMLYDILGRAVPHMFSTLNMVNMLHGVCWPSSSTVLLCITPTQGRSPRS